MRARLIIGFCVWLLPVLASAEGAHDLIIHDAWSLPMKQGQGAGVAYGTFENPTDHDIVLRQLSTEQAGRAEFHVHELTDDGVMQMKQLDSLRVPAHGKLELKPAGLHIMLFDLQKTLSDGDHYTLNLGEDSADVPLKILVRKQATAAN